MIEYGCRDGNQLESWRAILRIAALTVSEKDVELCRNLFKNDSMKTFRLMNHYSSETAQLTLSLDVMYHLIRLDCHVSSD